MPRGRPLHEYWQQAGFVALKQGYRNSAHCLICSKVLKNTAQTRLKAHRNICNSLSQSKEKAEVDIIETSQDFEIEEPEDDAANKSSSSGDAYKSIEVFVDKNSDEIFIPETSSTPTSSLEQKPQVLQTEQRTSIKQIRIDKHISTPAAGSSQKRRKLEPTPSCDYNEDINLAFGEFFFSCNIPFTVINSIYFKQFVEKLNKSYKLPNLKELSTVCLNQVYEKCLTGVPVEEQPAVLILTGWKHFTDNAKYIVACLQLKDESREFLNTWDFDIFTDAEQGLTKILVEAEILAKSLYNAKLFAIISDTVKFKDRTDNSNLLWHTICHSYLAGLLAEDIIDKEVSRSVLQVLKELQNSELEEQILEKNGTRIVLPWENRWCTYRDAFQWYLRNYEIVRELIAKRTSSIHSATRKILFDDEIPQQLQDYVHMLEPLCKLIYLSQKKKTNLAEITEEWIKLEFPVEFQQHLEKRRDTAFSVHALAANFVHPQYRGRSLSDEQMEMVEYFFLETLDSKGLDDMFIFKANGGVFKILTDKGITTVTTFWSIAGRKHPELALAALNLLRIPTSASYVDKLFSTWFVTHLPTRNMLGMEVYKKLMKTFFTLRLSNINNNIS